MTGRRREEEDDEQEDESSIGLTLDVKPVGASDKGFVELLKLLDVFDDESIDERFDNELEG